MQNKAAVLMRREGKKGAVTLWVAAEKVKAFERRGFVQVRGGEKGKVEAEVEKKG